MSRSTAHPAQVHVRGGDHTTSAARRRTRRTAVAAVALALAVAGLPLPAWAAPALDDTTATQAPTVSAEALPTVQINGTAYAQVVVGTTVYVAGQFTSARPAGSPAGTNETPRHNLLAYDITTGQLTGWAPYVNGRVNAIAASPDGRKIYVGGDFGTAGSQSTTSPPTQTFSRGRFAAFDARTGVLDGTVRPSMTAPVRAIVATATTVYFAGNFTSVTPPGGTAQTRGRVASVNATTGALNTFAPNVQGLQVDSLLLTPDASKLVIGGRFSFINGRDHKGIGWVNATTGVEVAFPANKTIVNYGPSASIYSLSLVDGQIIASGFGRLDNNDGSVANLEGIFAADATTGAFRWIADCHGDTYSSFGSPDGHIYIAGHPHDCSNAGGFPEASPRVNRYALAFSKDARHPTVKNAFPNSYAEWRGTPSAELANWFPAFTPASATAPNGSTQSQAVWSVTGNADYVVYGGEFPAINGVAQQGLVRFGKRTDANPASMPPVVDRPGISTARLASNAVMLSWNVATDPDDAVLTYTVRRGTTVVATLKHDSRYWDRSRLSAVDTGATNGQAAQYTVTVSDAGGRSATYTTTPVTVTPVLGQALSPYAKTILDDAPSNYWRMNDTTTQVTNWTGFVNGTSTGATTGVTGAIAGDPNTAMRFAGTSTSYASSSPATPVTSERATSSMSVEAWFQTTSTTGGKIVGFGSARTGSSTSFDRQLYMSDDGRLSFGVFPQEAKAISSPATRPYNDGAWHHVVGTLGAQGLRLYVDGALVASDAGTITAQQPFTGFWRIGGDSLNGWTPTATSGWFAGAIDEVATYNHPLSAEDVQRHFSFGTTGEAPKLPPTAAMTTTVDRLTVSVDGSTSTDPDSPITGYAWDFGDGATGSGARATHTYTAPGTYPVKLTVTDATGLTATRTEQVTVVTGLPTAAMTVQTAGLTVSVDGSTSSDPDGTITGHQWTFGEGAGATGATASHTYPAAGTYPVTLTVTDDDGQTATVTQDVTVSPAPTVVGRDAFTRTTTSGWGAAEVGGGWTTSANVATVSGGVGVLNLAGANSTAGARLPGAAGTTVVTTVTTSLDKVPNGGGAYGLVRGRIAANGEEYRLKLHYQANGTVRAWLARSAGTTETVIGTVNPSAATYAAGTALVAKLEVAGTSPTTLRAKVWRQGAAEPATWTVQGTDATATLQSAGHVGVFGQLTSTVTNGPVAMRVDDVLVTSAGAPAPAPNVAPTAAFTSSVSGLVASVDARTSSDSDGTVARYDWEFGDGSTGTGAQASRTYAAAGTYTVRLTVTDDDGATAVTTGSVTVASAPAPNVAPTAAFTSSVSGLAASVDARTSSDSDGTVARYDWDFGDGSTGTGAQASRTYAAAGTYTVRLTVTDDDGATATTTRDVTVTSAAPAARLLAQDAFERTVTSGFGTAELGGAWTATANVTSVSGGAGQLRLAAANSAASARLPSAVGTSVVTQVTTTLDKRPNGVGAYGLVRARITANDDAYRLKVNYRPDGTIRAWWTRTISGAETVAGPTVTAPVTYSAGTPVVIKVATTGTSPTRLRAKIWAQGTAEPAAWLIDFTDSELNPATLQTSGHVGVYGQLSSSTTNGPVVVRFDDFSATEGAPE